MMPAEVISGVGRRVRQGTIAPQDCAGHPAAGGPPYTARVPDDRFERADRPAGGRPAGVALPPGV
jgi:hypothetical protein